MAQNWRGSFVIFQGTLTRIAKKPYIFFISLGGVYTPCPPLDPPLGNIVYLPNMIEKENPAYTLESTEVTAIKPTSNVVFLHKQFVIYCKI